MQWLRRHKLAADERLLYKGHVIRPGDHVKATDVHAVTKFYKVVRVWGHHGVFRPITENEAGANPIEITVQPEAKR